MATKRTRKKKAPASPLGPLRSCVGIERAGHRIEIQDVPADQCVEVLIALIAALREATEIHPELVVDLGPVGGYNPIDFKDDDYADEGWIPKKRGERRQH